MTNFPWNNGGGSPVHFQNSLTGGQYDYDACITRLDLATVHIVNIKENEKIAGQINIFPNPTQDILNVKMLDFQYNRNFTIFNTMGQIMATGQLNKNTSQINVSSLVDGMYFIEISDKETKSTGKFIKQ